MNATIIIYFGEHVKQGNTKEFDNVFYFRYDTNNMGKAGQGLSLIPNQKGESLWKT